MRLIIYGAGGIGGAIGGRLRLSGHDVVLVARGTHLAALQSDGLLLRTPDGDHRLRIPAVSHPREIDFRDGDVVFLTMKTQDTAAALHDLELAAPPEIPVICAQNGVENERLAARCFVNVYAMLVALPATHLEPGEVIASGGPLTGALHAGRYPRGVDSIIEQVCASLRASNFTADAEPDPMKLKYRKLMLNLGNGLEVVVGQTAWGAGGALGAFAEKMREEAANCYRAAGITSTDVEEYRHRVTDHYRSQPIGGQQRGASSTWQSVLRGHSTIEVDYLNGEISLLGRLHGVATPHNDVVRREAVLMAAGRKKPGSMTLDELTAAVEAASRG